VASSLTRAADLLPGLEPALRCDDRDWNAQSPSQAGYVTRFDVADSFASQFPRQIVGGREHEELWVPAERMGELNDGLIGSIRLVDAFFGSRFRGITDLETGEELRRFIAALAISENALLSAIDSSRSAVFLSYPYWATLSADRYKFELPLELVLRSIKEAWQRLSPDTPLHP